MPCRDGQEAWALLQRESIDVVVSDVMMPGLDGLGLAARIKASAGFSHVPVILVTARGGSEASTSALESGADDYIAKPFSPHELRARVRAALRMGQLQAQLRGKSREAGEIMVATGILHNLGNILSGVTASSTVIKDMLRGSRTPTLHKIVQLLHEHANDLPGFIANDSRGQALPALLEKLSEHLRAEHAALSSEAETLGACAEHVAGVIATQQNFAGSATGLRELVPLDGLMEAALKLSVSAFEMQGVAVERDYACTTSVAVDRHKVLQILLNLLSNARHAVHDVPQAEKHVWVRTARAGNRVRLQVADNGAGVDPQHQSLLFNQGFTTKTSAGHGFGLHSSANWARELGGSLTCHSDGLGRGATFTLDLPALSPDEQHAERDSTAPAEVA